MCPADPQLLWSPKLFSTLEILKHTMALIGMEIAVKWWSFSWHLQISWPLHSSDVRYHQVNTSPSPFLGITIALQTLPNLKPEKTSLAHVSFALLKISQITIITCGRQRNNATVGSSPRRVLKCNALYLHMGFLSSLWKAQSPFMQ